MVKIRVRTREALRNLFGILDIEGFTFDDQLFELATRAFKGKGTPVVPVRKRSGKGYRIPRRQIEIKGTTYHRLQDLFPRLFPYLPWQSWDWYIQQLAEIAEETKHTREPEMRVFSPDK